MSFRPGKFRGRANLAHRGPLLPSSPVITLRSRAFPPLFEISFDAGLTFLGDGLRRVHALSPSPCNRLISLAPISLTSGADQRRASSRSRWRREALDGVGKKRWWSVVFATVAKVKKLPSRLASHLSVSLFSLPAVYFREIGFRSGSGAANTAGRHRKWDRKCGLERREYRRALFFLRPHRLASPFIFRSPFRRDGGGEEVARVRYVSDTFPSTNCVACIKSVVNPPSCRAPRRTTRDIRRLFEKKKEKIATFDVLRFVVVGQIVTARRK